MSTTTSAVTAMYQAQTAALKARGDANALKRLAAQSGDPDEVQTAERLERSAQDAEARARAATAYVASLAKPTQSKPSPTKSQPKSSRFPTWGWWVIGSVAAAGVGYVGYKSLSKRGRR